MDKFSFLSAMHTKMVDSMYEQYIKDPNSVDESWRRFFQGFDFAKEVYSEEEILSNTFSKEFNVINLINEYRKRGHLFTKTNPVRERRKYSPSLEIENFGLNEKDLDTVFQAGIEVGLGPSKLKDIVLHLKQVYLILKCLMANLLLEMSLGWSALVMVQSQEQLTFMQR